MSIGVQILHLTVIGPLMGDVKGGCDGTTVGINTALLKEIRVQLLVQVIY